MKSSQSYINLRSPDAYLFCSCLITTVSSSRHVFTNPGSTNTEFFLDICSLFLSVSNGFAFENQNSQKKAIGVFSSEKQLKYYLCIHVEQNAKSSKLSRLIVHFQCLHGQYWGRHVFQPKLDSDWQVQPLLKSYGCTCKSR